MPRASAAAPAPPAHPAARLPAARLQLGFKLFGFIPGSVGLRGRFVSIPEKEGGEDRKDTVKVRRRGCRHGAAHGGC